MLSYSWRIQRLAMNKIIWQFCLRHYQRSTLVQNDSISLGHIFYHFLYVRERKNYNFVDHSRIQPTVHLQMGLIVFPILLKFINNFVPVRRYASVVCATTSVCLSVTS